MKRTTPAFLLAAFLLTASDGSATGILSPQEALARYESTEHLPATRSKTDYKLIKTYEDSKGVASSYIFSKGNEGYVILSADEVAYPMLGYSDTGIFDPNNVPPQLECLLEQYALQIEYARNLDLPSQYSATRNTSLTGLPPVAPMVSANWNQGTPYNNACPEKDGKKTLTGCVATSMAQVMDYFQYPAQGSGSIKYYCKNLGKNLELDFTELTFDWDNMLSSYHEGQYDEDQAEAVANLMMACGFSVEMEYSPVLSLSYSYLVPLALTKYFNYAESCRYVSRKEYSGSQWEEMIYDNLKNLGPVIYDATSPMAGGHSFVCDGYDGNGYFHFNWGWSGSSNGYYSLDALNPTDLGTGVGSVTGFNIDQDAVLGIRLPDGNDYSSPLNLIQYGSLTASIYGDKLRFNAVTDNWNESAGLANENALPITFSVGAFINSLENDSFSEIVKGTIAGQDELSLLPYTMYVYSNEGNPEITIPSDLNDGKYKVTLACCDLEYKTKEWQTVKTFYGNPNYVILKIDNGKYEVENITPAKVEIPHAEFTTGLYYTRPAALKATIVNNSDFEQTKSMTPVLLFNGSIFFTGETILVSLQPNETVEKEWVTKFYSSNYITGPVEFTLSLIEAETNATYGIYQTITMEMDPGSPILGLNELKITNASVAVETIDGIGEVPVYSLNEDNFIEVELGLNVLHGYLANQVILDVAEISDENNWETIYQSYAFGEEGETWHASIKSSLLENQSGNYYTLTAKYWGNSYYREIGNPIYFKIENSNVESLFQGNSNEEWKYYNLQGMPVTNPQKGSILIRKKGNISQKVVI